MHTQCYSKGGLHWVIFRVICGDWRSCWWSTSHRHHYMCCCVRHHFQKVRTCFHIYTIFLYINCIFVFQKIKLFLLVLIPISRHPFYRDLGIKQLYMPLCKVIYTPLLCQGDAVLAPYTANSNAWHRSVF